MRSKEAGRAPAKRGFRRLSFDEAFPLAVEEAELEERLARPLTDVERQQLEARRRGLGNKITPAFRQASARLDSMVRREATAWKAQHAGMPNINAFIRHFQSLPNSKRLYQRGTMQPLSDDAIRKKLRKMGLI
jgi:hypothetical protein